MNGTRPGISGFLQKYGRRFTEAFYVEQMSLSVRHCHTLSTVPRHLLSPLSGEPWLMVWRGHVGDQRWVRRGLPTMAGCRCLWLSVGCARSLTELLLLLRLRFAAWHSVSVDNSCCPRLGGVGMHSALSTCCIDMLSDGVVTLIVAGQPARVEVYCAALFW